METGSSSEFDKTLIQRNGKRNNKNNDHHVAEKVEPFVPKSEHNPRELRSWAKRTGFVSDYSGEAGTSNSASEKFDAGVVVGLNRNEQRKNGGGGASIDPNLGRMREDGRSEIQPENGPIRRDIEAKHGFNGNGNVNGVVSREGNGSNGHGSSTVAPVPEVKEEEEDVAEGDVKVDVYNEGEGLGGGGGWLRPHGLKCGLRENPGFVLLIYYSLQHYLSLAGSLIFIPLIMVPAMGGTDKDTATVISTMLFISGITTILHSFFGTRLPLVQGSSFVYLAPALVIMNAQEYRNLTEHRFRHIMRELQGAIIVGSTFQCILGFSGLMSLLVRLINPIVVAPTVAAVGLAFFSYGFPQAGNCMEISIPLIVLVLIFTLYLRGISIFGRHIFRIYAVPLSVTIIWIYASFLTAGGAYNYKGCSPNIPSSNILNDACRRHAFTMKYCRTDVSNALLTAEWVRFPYPLQWGIPIFNFRTSLIMIIVSLVASVDSVGTYHTASLRVNSRAPTPGVVSRGIGVEGFCSILAGIWGSGTGSTTLTENMHTIDITKVANRKVVEIGAALLILFSFFGKVGALLASIPLALAASVLCFMWALTTALGLSTLQYGQSSSFRNITIVGVSLFLGLSVPAYFQQYQPVTALILPSYLIPYAAASSGPFNTGLQQLDFAVNGFLSMNMVVTFLVAFILDNTVPGNRQERGVYVWTQHAELSADPSLPSDEYSLPRKVGWCCCRPKSLGV